MSKQKSQIVALILFAILIFTSIFFRFYNLGYSDYQGDEVKAQGFFFQSRQFKDFILNNSKGPGQYVITKYVHEQFINPDNYSNHEFILRLPFAIAGLLAIIFVYLLAREFASKNAALVISILVSLSGLLIAFNRIVQYQSFVILSSVVSVYAIALYAKKKQPSYLFISGIVGSLGILFHFDAISYILPIILFLLFKYKNIKILATYLIPLLTALIFYIPYTMGVEFQNTLRYLYYDRTVNPFYFDSIFYSGKLFHIYYPPEYILFVLAGILYWVFHRFKKANYIIKIVIATTILILALRFINEHPRRLFIYPSTLLVIFLLFSYLKSLTGKKETSAKPLIEIWLITTFLIYTVLMKKPLTHIYTYTIPAIIVSFVYLLKLKPKKLVYTLAGFIIIGSISFNYKAYVDGTSEYPWQDDKYIYGNMKTNIPNGEKIRGIFGFPYNRNLDTLPESISEIRDKHSVTRYFSNEKFDRVKYYVPGLTWNNTPPYFLIHIKNSWEPQNDIPEIGEADPIHKGDKYDIYLINPSSRIF